MDAHSLARLPLNTLQDYLSEAHSALNRLMVGDREVLVTWSDGRRVQFSEVDADKLSAYVAALDAAVQAKQHQRPARAPVYLEF